MENWVSEPHKKVSWLVDGIHWLINPRSSVGLLLGGGEMRGRDEYGGCCHDAVLPLLTHSGFDYCRLLTGALIGTYSARCGIAAGLCHFYSINWNIELSKASWGQIISINILQFDHYLSSSICLAARLEILCGTVAELSLELYLARVTLLVPILQVNIWYMAVYSTLSTVFIFRPILNADDDKPLSNHVTLADAVTSIARCSSRHFPESCGLSVWAIESIWHKTCSNTINSLPYTLGSAALNPWICFGSSRGFIDFLSSRNVIYMWRRAYMLRSSQDAQYPLQVALYNITYINLNLNTL